MQTGSTGTIDGDIVASQVLMGGTAMQRVTLRPWFQAVDPRIAGDLLRLVPGREIRAVAHQERPDPVPRLQTAGPRAVTTCKAGIARALP